MRVQYVDEFGQMTVGWKNIDTICNLQHTNLAFDSKAMPKFKIDIPLETITDALAEYDSIEIREEGPKIIRALKNTYGLVDPIVFLKPSEYAKKHGISIDTVYRQIKKGLIKGVSRTKGRHYRIME